MDLVFGAGAPRPLGDPAGVAEALLELYPWPEGRRWVRAMMVTTLDGAAAGADGLSGSISSGVDRAVFGAVRRLADAVLVGAGTVRSEGYGPMRAKPDDVDLRAARGKHSAPRLAIVTGHLDLDWSDELFSASALTPLVITGPAADPGEIERARQVAEVVVTDADRDGHVTAADAVRACEERGLLHVVCEGGPTLLRGLAADGLLDEADITISPRFAGTENTPRTPMLDDAAELRLAHALHADGYLMNRYLVDPEAPGADA